MRQYPTGKVLLVILPVGAHRAVWPVTQERILFRQLHKVDTMLCLLALCLATLALQAVPLWRSSRICSHHAESVIGLYLFVCNCTKSATLLG